MTEFAMSHHLVDDVEFCKTATVLTWQAFIRPAW